MRVLILGGTRFVGPALIDDALARGWDVTAMSRGTSGEPASGVTFVAADRTEPGAFVGVKGAFDLVVDTWSGAPWVVRDAVGALHDRAGYYAYVSTRSVYRSPLPVGADEQAPLVEGSSDADARGYPVDKRGAEMAVAQGFPGRHLLARAGLVLGPRENIGRLPWWLRRLAAGGDVLAPGPRELPLQYVDARDLAAFCLDLPAAGAYNVVSEPGHTTMGELLELCRTVTGSNARLVWTSPEPILAAGVEPWTQLPIWIPPGSEDYALHTGDTRKARAAGLACRPIAETVADTWAWLRDAGPEAGLPPADRPMGLAADRERAILRG